MQEPRRNWPTKQPPDWRKVFPVRRDAGLTNLQPEVRALCTARPWNDVQAV